MKFENALSKVIVLPSGVSQGSHFGPVLFTLLINDLPSVVIHSNILMYADDFNSLDSISGQSILQTIIEYFCQWCEVNLMQLNFNKCKHMSFHRTFKLDIFSHFEDNQMILKSC